MVLPTDKRKSTEEIDRELEEILARQKAKIKVVGAGGGGNNTILKLVL